MTSLDDLGPRICILGPSNSGKSTLAAAIARKKNLQTVHLDQLHHRPNMGWEPRSADEFIVLQDEALRGERWVMDGNYSRCLPQRLARATGVISLDISTAGSLFRYVRRCRFESARTGGLGGGRDRVKWVMLHHISVTTRNIRARNAKRFDEMILPKMGLKTPSALRDFYRHEGLPGR